MKNILITGGLGFIGTNLIDRIQNIKNINIKVVDNNKKKKFKNKRIELIHGDILDKKLIIKASNGCDTIYHFAALTNVRDSLKYPNKYFSNNYIGTINLVNAAIKNKSNLIFASSAAVYPLDIKNKINEKIDFYPSNSYGLSKKLSENYILSKKKELKKFTIFRFFNVYGKRNINKNYSSVIPTFIKIAKQNKSMKVNNGGNQTRDFIHVSDVVEVCFKAGLVSTNKIINLGTGTATKIVVLAKSVKKILKKGKISKGDQVLNDAKYSCANIGKLKKYFKKKKFINIENGLRNIINGK